VTSTNTSTRPPRSSKSGSNGSSPNSLDGQRVMDLENPLAMKGKIVKAGSLYVDMRMQNNRYSAQGPKEGMGQRPNCQSSVSSCPRTDIVNPEWPRDNPDPHKELPTGAEQIRQGRCRTHEESGSLLQAPPGARGEGQAKHQQQELQVA
jgi:hypothetical protein